MPALATYSLTGDPYIDGLLGDVKWAVTSFTFSTPCTCLLLWQQVWQR
jgi:serralysin